MSEEFTKPLISSINASARFGVTNDYVARLCRKREVKGSLLGRTWYVDPDSLGEYLRAMHVKKEQKKISLSRDIQKWKQDHSLSRHTKSTSEPAMQRTESSPNAAHRKLEEIKKYFGVTSSVYPTLLHRSLTLSNAKRFLFASAILFFFSLSVTIGKFLPLPPGQEQFVARESTSAASALSQVFDFFFSKGTQNSQLRNNTTTQILPSKGSQNQYSQSGSQSAPTIIQQQVYPIRERTLVRVVSGVSEEHLTSRLSQLANTLRTEFSLYANVPTVPFPSLSGVMNAISLSQRIDKLSSVEITGGSITGATITGGSVTATSFSGVLQISSGGTGTSSVPTYGKLLVGQSDGSYTLMSTSSLGITGGGTIDGSGSTNLFAYWDDADTLGATSSPAVGYIVATSTTASSTLMGGLAVNSSIKTNIIDCSEALETNAAGFLVCGSDATSAGQANPFTWAANYGVIAAATSSAFWAQAGVFASSTSHFANVDFINATTTSLYIGTLNGPLQANQGRVSATTSIGVLYGGTGLTTAPSYGQLLVGNSSGGYSLLSTSTLGLLASSSLSATAPLSYNSQTGAFTITQATASTDGYLSSAHWNAFNNKISSTSLSGGTGISYNSTTGVISSTAGFPYTPTTNFAATANATSTAVWFQAGLQASSTSYFTNLSATNATTTSATSTNLFASVGVFTTLDAATGRITNLTTTGATTSALAVTASSTIAGQFNAMGGARFGTINATGVFTSTAGAANTIPFASTTAITATTASTTNLVVSSAGGSAGCATFSANGTISNTGTACGSGSGSAFPFTPSSNFGALANATGTEIWFQAGLQASSTSRFAGISAISATTTNFLSTGSSTIAGVLNAVAGGTLGGTFSGTPTYSGTPIFASGLLSTASTTIGANATTTGTFFAAIASSTSLYGAGLSTCQGGNVLTWNGGTFGCAQDQTAAGGANPFTWEVNYGVTTAATTSSLWAKNGLFASSTSHFANADFTGATTTDLAITGTASTTRLYGAGLNTCQSNNVLTWNNGLFGCEADDSGSGGSAFPFTPTNNFGVNTSATSTPLFAQAGLFASSTSRFAEISAISASTTLLTVTSSTTIAGVLNAVGGGILNISQATTSALAVSASTTIAGALNAVGGATFANLTAVNATSTNATSTNFFSTLGRFTTLEGTTGTITNLIATGATTTSLAISGTASTTRLYGAQLNTCNSGNVLTWSGGFFGCAQDQTAAGAANDFVFQVNYGVITAATTSPIWAQNGLFASSTSHFVNADFSGATSTGTFAVVGSTTVAGLLNAVGGAAFGNVTAAGSTTIAGVFNAVGGGNVSLTGATTSAFAVTGSTTISGQLNATGGTTLGALSLSGTITSSASGANTLPFASTTALTVSGTASTSALIVSGLNAADCDVKASTSGVLSCGTDAQGAGGGGFDFTVDSNFGALANSTSTPIWFKVGLQASSTSHFVDAQFGSATTSAFAITGSSTVSGQFNAVGGATFGSVSASSFTLGALNGPLHANSGVVAATTSIGVLYGGTGLTSAPSYGQLLVGSASGGYTFFATSTLGLLGSSSISGAGVISYTTQTGVFTTTGGTFGSGNYIFPSLVTIPNASTSQLSAAVAYFGGSATSTFTSAGFLGVGTSSPFAKLSIHAAANNGNTISLFAIGSSTASATTTLFSVENSGLVNVGDSSGTGDANFQFAADANAWSMGYNSVDKTFRIASSTNLSSNVYFQIGKSGTTSLSSGLGTGTGGNYLCIDTTTFEILRGNGAACTASSLRFKENVAELDYGLESVKRLRPVSFTYKPELNSGTSTHLGFIAEEVELIIPELVTYNKGVIQGLDYPTVSAVLAKAIQELSLNFETLASTTASSTPQSRGFAESFFENIFARMTQWLADATNGISKFVAGEVHTDVLCIKKSDGSDVCVTGDELANILADQELNGRGSAPTSAPQPPPEPEPTPEPAPELTPTPEPSPEEPVPTPATGEVDELEQSETQEPEPAPEPESTSDPISESESVPSSE